jgi:hypothetical protein
MPILGPSPPPPPYRSVWIQEQCTPDYDERKYRYWYIFTDNKEIPPFFWNPATAKSWCSPSLIHPFFKQSTEMLDLGQIRCCVYCFLFYWRLDSYFVCKKCCPAIHRSMLISCQPILLKVGKEKINIVNTAVDKVMPAIVLWSHQSLVLCKLQHSFSLWQPYFQR